MDKNELKQALVMFAYLVCGGMTVGHYSDHIMVVQILCVAAIFILSWICIIEYPRKLDEIDMMDKQIERLNKEIEKANAYIEALTKNRQN